MKICWKPNRSLPLCAPTTWRYMLQCVKSVSAYKSKKCYLVNTLMHVWMKINGSLHVWATNWKYKYWTRNVILSQACVLCQQTNQLISQALSSLSQLEHFQNGLTLVVPHAERTKKWCLNAKCRTFTGLRVACFLRSTYTSPTAMFRRRISARSSPNATTARFRACSVGWKASMHRS